VQAVLIQVVSIEKGTILLDDENDLSGFQNCVDLFGRKLVKRQALPREHDWLQGESLKRVRQ
jgi:hypothetical protein